ncbi:MAG: transglutaminase-like domain-containing protein [Bacteroidales bacterium]|nr:transglutaminase-like domain-containing protein [Bacteroidales bacterium]
MKRLSFILLMLVFVVQSGFSKEKFPVVRSNSFVVDIKDDGMLRKGAWRVVPEEKLDVYKSSAKRVTFYTDIDSISFNIDPKVGRYDFVIVVNGKDSAMTRIEYMPSYLEKLKGAKAYKRSDKREIPKFCYGSADDPDLARLRKELNLDSIAGKGRELSKIFNLLHWAHNVVKHDGNSTNPESKNAIDLINICKTQDRGVNCRMMATILNECYLAMGIQSRIVTCMPKETKFDDCHVINSVYSKDLNKWIWVDPTFDVYLMGEGGVILGIAEVRENLVKDKPIIVYEGVNWNGKKIEPEYYVYKYMAKNLYRMSSPAVSCYNMETCKPGKVIEYVELLPLDGIEQEPQKVVETNEKNGLKYITYKTNNPDKFWAAPRRRN